MRSPELHVVLDGTGSTHDRLRIGTHRARTFEQILENIEYALRCSVSIRLRVNADRAVLSGLEELADIFHRCGFLRSPLFSCYVKAIFGTKEGRETPKNAVTDTQIAKVISDSPRIAQIFSGYPVIHDRINSRLYGATKSALRSDHYGASSGRILIFDSLGRIFPCNNVVGDFHHQVGTYFPDLKWHTTVTERWGARTVGRLRDVAGCKYALLRGGGCLYDAQVQHGTIDRKSCNCSEFAYQFADLVRATYHRIFRAEALQTTQS